ncbi:uncharacterized protein UTRI_01736_B [Ustilago trichophora]|uniref:ASTRA-associated protein 1 n=1 Tax=Ustilago trichophora TaxID=86804 RepID=A0A5C3E226_9BASI|nr:uncharacterized protein UTRI_01736_B [Ustilago trichophora]
MNPYWILRHHASSSIRSLHFSHHLLAVGDDGGTVSLVDLRSLRPVSKWTAHKDSILTVLVIAQNQVVTHGRDNELKLWHLPNIPPSLGVGNSATETATPDLVRSIGVNALNFSRCSYNSSSGKIAVPNALDAAYIDILDLTTGVRSHEAIGRPDIKPSAGNRLPIVMSLHLSDEEVIAGYEDGQIKKWSLEGDLLWQVKCHSESVMNIALHKEDSFGISVGADDRIAHFDLDSGKTKLAQTKTPGKASTAIAPNGKTFAVGGWDGSIRIYSTGDMTELGQLSYHRDTVECLAFAYAKTGDQEDETSSDEDKDDDAKPAELILAAGGRDGKISLWKYH